MVGRPPGSPNRDKWFKEALRQEVAACGDRHKALRRVAAALLREAESGNVQAIRELGDRLDGRVPHAIGGSEELSPVRLVVTGIRTPEERND